MRTAAVVPALKHFNNVLNVNDTFLAEISARADSCGYTEFFNTYVDTFPPAGPIPAAPSSRHGCDLYNDIVTALTYVNPCFNIYHLTDFCPFLNDEMGFPSLGGGPNNYFNRSDVQAVIHAPPTDYSVCGDRALFPRGDQSVPSALGPLPSVIERTNNTIIGHGLLDFLLFANGSLITIQNMTWNGAQGFQTRPSATENFFVPYHPNIGQDAAGRVMAPFIDDAGSGFQGTTHTERGLTFVTVTLSGHGMYSLTLDISYFIVPP
jgi:carboxypeptidase D